MVTTPHEILIEFIKAEIARTGEPPRLMDIAKALNCSPQAIRILTFPELRSRKGITYCRQSLSRLERDGKFPRRVQISAGRVGWIEAEVDEWLQSKADARGGPLPKRSENQKPHTGSPARRGPRRFSSRC